MNKIWTGAAIMALSFAPAMAAVAHGSNTVGGFGDHHGMGGGFFLGPIMMILILAAVIALAVSVLRWLGIIPKGSSRNDALDILKERFAKGEINKKEYNDRRRVLEDED